LAAGLVYGLTALNKDWIARGAEWIARGAESTFRDPPALGAGMKLALIRVEERLICIKTSASARIDEGRDPGHWSGRALTHYNCWAGTKPRLHALGV
jgi:hypothetical protein